MPNGASAILIAVLAAAAGPVHAAAPDPAPMPRDPMAGAPGDRTISVFSDVVIDWKGTEPDIIDPDGFVVRHEGHTIDRTLDLPPAPRLQSDARRVVATVEVTPIYTMEDGKLRPNDKWTRLGNVSVLTPASGGGAPVEMELVRFITGYGAPGVFEQDVTSLAPYLHGRRTLRVFISSYSPQPGWKISLNLKYAADGVGARRPAMTRYLFGNPHVTTPRSTLVADVMVPDGTDVPRIRILSTGHATDGTAENEFVSCTHILRIDGREVARWRPWSEEGGTLRPLNPWAARQEVDGRELRSSDLDRSGWHPGLVVEPLIIPAPELTPGRHRVELEILGIRPPGPITVDGKRHHGYWCVSATIVADNPWPVE